MKQITSIMGNATFFACCFVVLAIIAVCIWQFIPDNSHHYAGSEKNFWEVEQVDTTGITSPGDTISLEEVLNDID